MQKEKSPVSLSVPLHIYLEFEPADAPPPQIYNSSTDLEDFFMAIRLKLKRSDCSRRKKKLEDLEQSASPFQAAD